MTDYVTDTNVGKMTEQEAIHEIELMEQMECACPDCERRRPALQMAIEALQFQESVVTCEECKYWDIEDGHKGFHNCMATEDLSSKPSDFCNYGERKE